MKRKEIKNISEKAKNISKLPPIKPMGAKERTRKLLIELKDLQTKNEYQNYEIFIPEGNIFLENNFNSRFYKSIFWCKFLIIRQFY